MSGVGISFGADRIFDVLNQLDLYPKEAVNGPLLVNTQHTKPEQSKLVDGDEPPHTYG